GSIAGVLVSDYWLVRRRDLQLEDLYLADGVYRGWNVRAIAATALGCALAWSGLVVPAVKPLYDYAWFVGFFAAGAAHLALAGPPSRSWRRREGVRYSSRRMATAPQVPAATTTPAERANQRHAVLAGFLGWTLDAFDFFILTLVIDDIAASFGRTRPDVAFAL